jgi:hypothetical protein
MKFPIDIIKLAPSISIIYKLWICSLRHQDRGSFITILRRHAAGQHFILCLWHEELFAITGYGFTKTRDLVTIVSQSRDGELITRVLHTLGHATARGSSSRGGLKAIFQAKRIMEREKRMAVFTIDGPQGPRRVPKDGPIVLAQLTGAKIVPIRAFPRHMLVFKKSWDHFQLPYPFTTCLVHVGTPYEVTQNKLTKPVLAMERERLAEAMALKARLCFNGCGGDRVQNTRFENNL